MLRRRFVLLLAVLSAVTLCPVGAGAETADNGDDSSATTNGRPRIKLDRLELPSDLPQAKQVEAHLRKTLRRETRRAEWGAGSDSKISYRFTVQRLELREEAGVLHVTCTALGRLPKGKSAKSHIVFGGDPRERQKVVERVLDIVARGVVTRLAELERARRTP